MILELRETKYDGVVVPRGLVFVVETDEESALLDQFFGKAAQDDGVIGEPKIAECRLSDGYGEHYILVR